jgi:hypothetical protein
MTAHEHVWVHDRELSTFATRRYRCECGALGYRGQASTKIREYVADSPAAKRVLEGGSGEVTARPRSAGTNAGGGYLPPGGSSGGRR